MNDLLRNFFLLFEKEGEAPKAYGPLHLTFFFTGLAVVALLCFLLRKTSEKQNRIVMFCCGVFLALIELFKQGFYFYIISDMHITWWIFPFQMCSVPIYLCLIVPFIKKDSVRDAMYAFMASFNLMGAFISFLEPSGLLHTRPVLTAHSLVWHMVLVFIGSYLAVNGRGVKNMKMFLHGCYVFFICCGIAFAINCIFYDVSGGDINMFFIGPATSNIAVFRDISAKLGWYVNAPIYMFSVCLGAFLFYMPPYLLFRNKGKKLPSEG